MFFGKVALNPTQTAFLPTYLNVKANAVDLAFDIFIPSTDPPHYPRKRSLSSGFVDQSLSAFRRIQSIWEKCHKTSYSGGMEASLKCNLLFVRRGRVLACAACYCGVCVTSYFCRICWSDMSAKSTAGRQADSGALKAWLIHSQTQKILRLRQSATVVHLTVFTCRMWHAALNSG